MNLGRMSTKNDIVKDSNRDAIEDRKPQQTESHSNLGLSDLWWCGISERLPAVNSATLYKLLYRHAVDRHALKSSRLQEGGTRYNRQMKQWKM